MRIRVVSGRNEITNLNPNDNMIHLAFRASYSDFINLMKRCPTLQMIQTPTSYRKTLSGAIQVFLNIQGIELLEGDVWGHRKDLDVYYTVEDATIEEIHNLTATGVSADDVAAQVRQKTKISPDLIKYIANTKVTA